MLHDAGFAVKENDVICVELPDQPGGLAGVLKVVSGAGVNIEYVYSLIGTYVVINVADIDRAICVTLIEKTSGFGIGGTSRVSRQKSAQDLNKYEVKGATWTLAPQSKGHGRGRCGCPTLVQDGDWWPAWLAHGVSLRRPVVALAGCGRRRQTPSERPGGAAQRPIKIGAIVSLTGTYAGLGACREEDDRDGESSASTTPAASTGGRSRSSSRTTAPTRPRPSPRPPSSSSRTRSSRSSARPAPGQSMAMRAEIDRAGIPQVSHGRRQRDHGHVRPAGVPDPVVEHDSSCRSCCST